MHRLMTLAALFFSLSAAAAEPGEPLLLTAPILEEGGEAFVNINNSHRPLAEIMEEDPDAEVVETEGGPALVVGVAELFVNINNSHRTAGGELHVNINNSH